MFTILLIAVFCGIMAGIVTGLIPGVHINLISVLLVSIAPFLIDYVSIMPLGVFIIAMAVTHTFLDVIPGIYLGVPDADAVEGVLPGHRLLMRGHAYDAVKLTVIGSLLCLILSVVLIPILVVGIASVYEFLLAHMGIILLAISCFIVFRDPNRRWANLLIFLISGVLGLLVLNLLDMQQPLFPLLSGLFGVSILLVSLADKTTIPRQYHHPHLRIDKSKIPRGVCAGFFAGLLTSFFPGLGAAQGAVIAQQFVKKMGDRGFLIIVGGISTANFTLSLATLLAIQKARNGAVVAIMDLLEITYLGGMVFLFVALIAGGCATILALWLSKIFSKIIVKVHYPTIALSIVGLLIIMAVFLSGWVGLLVLCTATSVGVLCAKLRVSKSVQMGCLLVPVMMYFLL